MFFFFGEVFCAKFPTHLTFIKFIKYKYCIIDWL